MTPPSSPAAASSTASQCLDLLAGGGYGRVVGTDSAMPAVHPISYVLDGQEVIFQSGSRQRLAATAGNVVAFQADEFDSVTGIGWTVLGIGRPYQLVANPAPAGDPGDSAAAADRAPAWPQRWPGPTG